MKKFSIIAMALLMTGFSAMAQTTSFGFKAGVNANTFLLNVDNSGDVTKYNLAKPGFHVGGIADLSFNSNFSIQPQLLFALKGGKLEQGGNSINFTFYTIDLPINFLYHHEGFFAGAGPNFSFGLSGKAKQSGNPDIDLYKESSLLGSGSKFNRFEFGVNAVMGYKFPSGLTVGTNFTPGLTDIFNEGLSGSGKVTSHNSFWGFSVGYLFGKTAKKK